MTNWNSKLDQIETKITLPASGYCVGRCPPTTWLITQLTWLNDDRLQCFRWLLVHIYPTTFLFIYEPVNDWSYRLFMEPNKSSRTYVRWCSWRPAAPASCVCAWSAYELFFACALSQPTCPMSLINWSHWYCYNLFQVIFIGFAVADRWRSFPSGWLLLNWAI